MKSKIIISALLMSFAGLAMAQTSTSGTRDHNFTPRLDKREANQQKRIDQGQLYG